MCLTDRVYHMTADTHLTPLTSDPAARTLRNVLRFLADIGDICNEKMGTPYRKCRSLFEEARSDCSELLGDFNFLCDIVDGFLPLCNLARGTSTYPSPCVDVDPQRHSGHKYQSYRRSGCNSRDLKNKTWNRSVRQDLLFKIQDSVTHVSVISVILFELFLGFD